MFQEEGLPAPDNLIETTALLFVTRMLQRSAPGGHDRHRGGAVLTWRTEMMVILPVTLPCKMDAYGLITRTDRLLSPAADVMLRALRQSAVAVYGMPLEDTALSA